jgi:hypothetical protein
MLQFAKETGQQWKVRIWLVLTAAALLASAAFFSLWQGNPAGLPEGITIAVYFPICVLWFVWWAAAIRCPVCRQRPVWHQMTHARVSDFEQSILTIAAWPSCGFNPCSSSGGGVGPTPAV